MESAKDRIRRLREQRRSRNRLDLTIPGYEGDLAVRYRTISEDRVKEFADRLQQAETGIDASKELIAEATECILVREGDELVPLTDEHGPIGFDERLAEYLGIEGEATSVKALITEVFSPGGVAPAAPVQHGVALTQWLQGNDSEIDKALLGE